MRYDQDPCGSTPIESAEAIIVCVDEHRSRGACHGG